MQIGFNCTIVAVLLSYRSLFMPTLQVSQQEVSLSLIHDLSMLALVWHSITTHFHHFPPTPSNSTALPILSALRKFFVVACFVFYVTLSAAVSSKDNRLFNRFWQRDKSDGVWKNDFLMNHNQNDNEIMAPCTLAEPSAFRGTRMIRNVCGGN